jgi:zinc protease
MLSALLVSAVIPLAWGSVSNGDGLPFKIETASLDNGVRLVMVPYASPGILAYFEMVRVGSRDEVEKGVTGFAHFFEHMMFRGTKEWPQDRVQEFLKKTGADQNGYTTNDYTCYTFFGRNDALEELVRMEADRFQNLEYTEDIFKTESKAVLGEYNKSASNPYLPLDEKLREMVFKKHTYGHTTLGYLKDIENMPNDFEYSRTFFKRFYTPDNLTIIAVGDFDPKTLVELAKKYYGPWASKRAVTKTETEPPQKKEARAEIAWKTPTLPWLSLSWRTPATKWESPESGAYNVLFELLFGKISPLYNELVLEKQLVDSFDDESANHRDPYLFEVIAKVKAANDVKAVEDRIEKQVEELRKGKLDPKLLEDVKSNVRYALLLSLQTPDHVAGMLAAAIAPTGELDSLEKLLKSLEKVSAKDVQAFVKKHLTKENRAIVVLETKGGAK